MATRARVRKAWLITVAFALLILPLSVGPAGAVDSNPPSPPTDLYAYTDDSGVHLSWSPPADADEAAISYRVYRAEEGATAGLIGESEDAAFVDTEADSLTAYAYFVTAVNGNGESMPSGEVQRPAYPHCMVIWGIGRYGLQIRPECLFPLPIPLKL